MNRLVLLDSGPLGLVTNPKESEASGRCNAWLRDLLRANVRVMVPEVTDYELRRELIRGGKLKGLGRLDALAEMIGYLEVTSEVWRRAAELWAWARNEGRPTAPDLALDGDVILAAQAQIAGEEGYKVIVASDNVRHLGRFVDARPWEEIGPDWPGGPADKAGEFHNRITEVTRLPEQSIVLMNVSTGDGRAVFVLDGIETVFRGGGNTDYICPGCKALLAEQVEPERIWDLVLVCSKCKGLVEFPRLPQASLVTGEYVFIPSGKYRITRTLDVLRRPLIIGVGAITGGGNPSLLTPSPN